jgi:large subunit ribosomal protein L30
MANEKKIQVTLVKSMFGRGAKHMGCVKGLGLRRMHQTVEVSYLLKWEEV